MLPRSLQQFIELFSSLPSIGPRQATRLAFHILKQGRGSIAELAEAIAGLGRIQPCSQCFFPFESGGSPHMCSICTNPNRKQNIVAIVERETDLISLEKPKRFNGRYLLLGEIGKDGMLTTEQKLRLNHLKSTIKKQFGQAEEIVIAVNSTTLGDLEASLIIQELKQFTKRITRLGRGLPTGGEIEFADEDTLGGALENRR